MGLDVMHRYQWPASMSSVAEISAEEIYPTQIDHNETVILCVQRGKKNSFLEASRTVWSVRGLVKGRGLVIKSQAIYCYPYTQSTISQYLNVKVASQSHLSFKRNHS